MRLTLLVSFIGLLAGCASVRPNPKLHAEYLTAHSHRSFSGELTLRENFTYVLRWRALHVSGPHSPPWRHEIELGHWRREGTEIVFSGGWQEFAKRSGSDFCMLWGRYTIERGLLEPIGGRAGIIVFHKKEPNKAPEPTPRPVMIPAEPGITPGRVVAHL